MALNTCLTYFAGPSPWLQQIAPWEMEFGAFGDLICSRCLLMGNAGDCPGIAGRLQGIARELLGVVKDNARIAEDCLNIARDC